MEPRTVDAGRGWQWIVSGFQLFRKNPVIWVALLLVYFFIALALSFIPMVGALLMTLLSPVFSAGFMLGCEALERGEELEIAHLFAGFRRNTTNLVTVGGLYLVGSIVIFGIVMGLGGSAFMGGSLFGGATPEAMTSGPALSAALFAMILLVPLIMAYWFAPPLVVFHGIPAVDAMKLSFRGCMQNFMPFLVYGAVLLALGFVAMIPLGLGFLVLFPVIFASTYTSYKDIFLEPQSAAVDVSGPVEP